MSSIFFLAISLFFSVHSLAIDHEFEKYLNLYAEISRLYPDLVSPNSDIIFKEVYEHNKGDEKAIRNHFILLNKLTGGYNSNLPNWKKDILGRYKIKITDELESLFDKLIHLTKLKTKRDISFQEKRRVETKISILKGDNLLSPANDEILKELEKEKTKTLGEEFLDLSKSDPQKIIDLVKNSTELHRKITQKLIEKLENEYEPIKNSYLNFKDEIRDLEKEIKKNNPDILKDSKLRRALRLINTILDSNPLMLSYDKNAIMHPKNGECFPDDLRARVFFLPNGNTLSQVARRLEYNPAFELLNNEYSKSADNKKYDKKIIDTVWKKQNYEKTKDQLLSYVVDTQIYEKGKFILALSWGDKIHTAKGMRYFVISEDIFKKDLEDKILELTLAKIVWETIKHNEKEVVVPNIEVKFNLVDINKISKELFHKEIKFTEMAVLKKGETKQSSGYTSINTTSLNLITVFSDEDLGNIKNDIQDVSLREVQ